MASGPVSRAEEQPPALPVKQHRSRSSVESDCVMFSPVGLQHQNYAYNEVFPEPTDCHAAQCPIHQRYDPSQHQVRFFSDGTPPPVPRKRLARTLSLPGFNAPPQSPLTPSSPRQPHNFDNPLYMLAPVPDTFFHEETVEFQAVTGSPGPSLTFSQLSFDTPDEHLPYLFSSFDDQRAVFQGIQHRHLLFLRSMAQSVDAGILLQGEAAGRDAGPYQPQDFLLCEGSEPKHIGDAVYYSLHSPKLPRRVLGLRVHEQTDDAASAHTKHQPSHVNLQHVIARFQPSRNDSSVIQTQPGCITAITPGGGSSENNNLPSVQSLLQKGQSVSVERDLPRATLEDFVQDTISLQSTDCLDYDRQVCVLLLQVLTGSLHLYNIGASAPELRPLEIFLVWSNREKEEAGNKQGQNASLKEAIDWEKMERKGKVLALWRTLGSPRVVLTPLTSALPVPHPFIHIKSQIGALIQYCLHSQESLTSLDSTQSKSPYRIGLLHLASLLQSESNGPQMADMVAMLQVLLWGPRVQLFDRRCPMTAAVHNWLAVKRALLVMKLAERGLVQDQSAVDWEDCMCLKFLSFADPETVASATSQLWLTLNVD